MSIFLLHYISRLNIILFHNWKILEQKIRDNHGEFIGKRKIKINE